MKTFIRRENLAGHGSSLCRQQEVPPTAHIELAMLGDPDTWHAGKITNKTENKIKLSLLTNITCSTAKLSANVKL